MLAVEMLAIINFDGTLHAFLGSLTNIIGITNLEISYNKFSGNVSSSFHNFYVGLSML
jgi:hypothetical protein